MVKMAERVKNPECWASKVICRYEEAPVGKRYLHDGDDKIMVAEIKRTRARIATLEAEVSRLTALLDEAKTPTHRHKKRGSEYVLIGIGKMQAEGWCSPSIHGIATVPVDMREVAIYRSVDDGALWVRPREEFEDGRFEEIARAFAEKAGA